jgi:hypothetical protein
MNWHTPTLTPLPETTHNGISVHDIITAYTPGYHQVTGFHTNSETPEIQVDYRTIQDSQGRKPKTPKTNSCAIPYCTKIDHAYIQQQCENDIQTANNKKNNLLKLLQENTQI